MTTNLSIHHRTTEELAQLIREQQQRVDALCHECGAIGVVRLPDSTALLCGRCALIAKGAIPNDD
jgi:hypothetical protein